jgi:hypothetical protein
VHNPLAEEGERLAVVASREKLSAPKDGAKLAKLLRFAFDASIYRDNQYQDTDT